MTSISLSTNSLPQFSYFTLQGNDSIKFLQGQLTCNVEKLQPTDHHQKKYQPTAISNLKGRVQFGIWITKVIDDHYEIVISADCADDFSVHVKKFGAFSKITLSEPKPIYPCVINDEATFSVNVNNTAEGSIDEGSIDEINNCELWTKKSIATGNYWITKEISDIFQPQELRLHQRGGIDYDKGCYLGQEVIARIYFKSSPKSFLHRISSSSTNTALPLSGSTIGESNRIKVVNACLTDNGFEALVISRPDIIEKSNEFTQLDMPSHLMAHVSRKP